uniref:Osteocalcin n=1 Tax=Nothoprocta perdicaria TaxID=30464 RepID=A0A8C6YV90_NOTPE
MRTLALLALLVLGTLGHQGKGDPKGARSPGTHWGQGTRGGWFGGAQAWKGTPVRRRRSREEGAAAPAAPDPLEATREVCELSPDCDELADQIGLPAAYQRLYGTTVR